MGLCACEFFTVPSYLLIVKTLLGWERHLRVPFIHNRSGFFGLQALGWGSWRSVTCPTFCQDPLECGSVTYGCLSPKSEWLFGLQELGRGSWRSVTCPNTCQDPLECGSVTYGCLSPKSEWFLWPPRTWQESLAICDLPQALI